MRVHVAGTGKMGLPMARLLQGGGHVLSISDPDPERLRLARAEGLEVMASDAGIAAAECILSSLPHDAAFLDFGGRVVRHARRGALYVDTSTVSQQASAHVGGLCAGAGRRPSPSAARPRPCGCCRRR